jgi:hypothetical protein
MVELLHIVVRRGAILSGYFEMASVFLNQKDDKVL